MSRLWLFLALLIVLATSTRVSGEEPFRGPAIDFDRELSAPAATLSPEKQPAEKPIPLQRNPELLASEDEASTGGLPSFGVVLTALAFVLLLALGIAKLFGKTPAAISSRAISPVDVLFRQSVDPKNAICIVRVGPRLLVLSSSANGLSPLSEITDPIEVEALTIELRAARESSDGALGFVSRWFDRSAPTEDTNARPVRPTPAPSPHDSVAGMTVREVEEGRRAG
jgi:flagellar biogenesis protein FliO